MENKFRKARIEWVGIDFGFGYPRTQYLPGLLNDALGNTVEAIRAYGEFPDIWKETDRNFPELLDAQTTWVRLKGKNRNDWEKVPSYKILEKLGNNGILSIL